MDRNSHRRSRDRRGRDTSGRSDAVVDTAAIQREAHVSTTIVNLIDFGVMVEHGDGMYPTGNYYEVPFFQVVQGANLDASNY